MEKNIKDYTKYYIGCEVAELPKGKHDGMCIDRITSVTEDGDVFVSNGYMLKADSIKPILRKLESITDDEIKELIGWEKVSKMYLNTAYRKHQSGIRVVYDVDTGSEGIYPHEYFVNFREFDPQHFHYLLSKGFDLFGLIESGLAIEKQPTTQK